jgi:hypothetical protein
VGFAAITLFVVSQRVFIVIVYFVIDSVRKLSDTPSYTSVTPYVFMALKLIQHRSNFTFTFYVYIKRVIQDS